MPENDENPVTLASLRGRPARARSPRFPAAPGPDTPPQLGLFLGQSPVLTESPGASKPPPSPKLPSPVADPQLLPARALPQAAPRPHLTPPPPPRAERRVWSVRSLLSDLRSRIESAHAELWVEGEISTCRPAASGHLYLTLRDGDAQLPVVLFRRQAQLLRFRPAAGMAVLVRGRLSVYEGRGELQLIGETLEPRGAGALLLAFEQLKARLAAEGLFDAARKRPLPPFPRCLGIVTSTSGAVLHDLITVIRRRHARLNLLVFPALMQGAGSPASVAAGIRWFNRNPGRADLIVLARGGGSPEDLAGFNDEALARAIAASTLPVVSAIGHETDFTIADFVADLRAPTPSAAAELITAAQHRIEERLDTLERTLRRAVRYRLLEARQRFARTSADHVLRRVQAGLDRRQQRLGDLDRRLSRASERLSANRSHRLDQLGARLARQHPATRLTADRTRLARLEQCLTHAGPQLARRRSEHLARLSARLHALSPLAVLARGYALVYTLEGPANVPGSPNRSLISSSSETAPGRRILARLASGSLIAEVTEINPE